MSKPKAQILTTDGEFDAAIARATLRESYRPKAVAATYRPADDMVAITLATGVELAIPRGLLQAWMGQRPRNLPALRSWARAIVCTGKRSTWTTMFPVSLKACLVTGAG